MADSYMNGIVCVHVATFCVIFLLKCKEYTDLWTYVQNRNKKYMDKNHTKTNQVLSRNG